MKIVWNEQSVRWFHNASEYTRYHENLAKILLEHIPCRETLCDMGCGAGMIDFELAPYIGQITCVDISQEAVQSVAETAKQRGIHNITAVCADGGSMKQQWDTVIALYHGGTDAISTYFPMVKDRLILVTHGEALGNFGPKGHKVRKCFDSMGFKERMDELGVQYELNYTALEYGQPFQDRSEAEAFVTAYTMPMGPEDMEKYLAAHLVETGDEKYPLYIPNQKKMGIFIIRRDEN